MGYYATSNDCLVSGATQDSTCGVCGPGTYNADPWGQSCTSCVAGSTYQPNSGQGGCLACSVCTSSQKRTTSCTVDTGSVCENCVAPSKTVDGTAATCNECVRPRYPVAGTETCLSCAAGYYSQTVGGVFSCVQCVCTGGAGGVTQVYTACPQGTPKLTALGVATQICIACSGGDNSGITCDTGYEPNVRCDGTQTADSSCVGCPNGKQRPAALKLTSKWCELCPTGKYKAGVSVSDCGICTNKLPLGSGVAVYDAWPDAANRGQNSCPWSCVAGYYKPSSGTAACVACNATRGTYALAGTVGQCAACTNKPLSNSYYQLPRGFDGRSDNCPW